jgi:hypothetical protein
MSNHTSPEARTPFPVDCLPSPCRDMALGLAGLFQCSVNLPGMCVLGALNAAVADRFVAVNPVTKDETPPNLFQLGIGHSGDGKSRVMKWAFAPIFDHEAAITAHWEKHVVPRVNARKKVIEAQISTLLSTQKTAVKKALGSGGDGLAGRTDEYAFAPEEPVLLDPESAKVIEDKLAKLQVALAEAETLLVRPRLIVDDVTPEKLVSLMAKSCFIISATAEARKAIDVVLGCYSSSKSDNTAEDVYLKGFSGDPIKVDRQAGGTIDIPHPCICLLWLVQPGKAEQLLSSHSLRDGGFLQRCLVGHADSNPGNRLNSIEIPKEVVSAYAQLLAGIMQIVRDPGNPMRVHMTYAAGIRVNQVHEDVRSHWVDGDEDKRSFECRYAELVVRIALTLHVGRHGAESINKPLDVQEIENAIQVLGFYTQNHVQVLTAAEHSQEVRAHAEIAALLKTYGGAFTLREARRSPLGRMFSGEKLVAYLAQEIAEGRLWKYKDGRTERYTDQRHRL